ncbi:hypothetical protein HYX11_02255 [Candidatus Woesearchaeota archaeon]|nr:hypothetical protein [Candidatus Woesearchaeota archaeon]
MKKRDRKAQITVFMILGLLILFAALFVVMLTMNIKKSSLQGEQEKILTQVFKKEALRVYVEDCLKDNMEEGIDLLAKQGRIWNDQPGGSEEFINDVTGISDGKERIYYGISRKLFPKEIFNAFPCKDETNTPMFCGYSYPQMAEFGQLKLRKDAIFQKDLKNFLINRTVWCVENFTKSNISQEAQVVSTNLELTLEETDEGINVLVNYPLKIKLNKEELFHLTKFDFFYPTKFKQVLDVTMFYPLQWDQKFVDFNYDNVSLNADYFEYNSPIDVKENCLFNDAGDYTCKRKTLKDKYTELEIKMQKNNYSGDDIFVFMMPIQNIFPDRSGDFKLQIARQNRPPVLDYVHRENCSNKGYDYLVILGDEKLGEVNINLSAHDADEDKIKEYRFDSAGGLVNDNSLNSLVGDKLFIGKDKLTHNLGLKTISVNVLDEHGLSDWQEVRVLVDKSMKTSFSIDIPYKINKEGKSVDYAIFFKNGKDYLISQEDPFILKLQLPTAQDTIQNAELKYISNTEGENFNLNVYNLDFIKQGKIQVIAPNFNKEKFDDYKIDEQRNYFNVVGEGVLSLSYARAYCNEDKKDISEAKIEVKQCIPHFNPEYPYAYPYNKYNFGLDIKGMTNLNDFKGEKEINPFLATHSCCNADWTVKDKTQVCFTNPAMSCGGEGYWLGNLVIKCDAKSGNKCEGQSDFNLLKQNNNNVCGDKKYKDCKNIPLECSEKEAWSLVDDNKKWCYGNHGCENVCESVIVSDANLDFENIKLEYAQFHCGCNNEDVAKAKKCRILSSGYEGKCSATGCT